MNDAQYARDLKVMAEADAKHLQEDIEAGNRANARTHLDALIDTRRAQEDLNRS